MPAARLPNEVADRDRLQRIAAGEVAALRGFYESHVGRVWGFARRLLGDDHEAEEVTQDVFVRVWRKAAEYDHRRASPWGWLAMMTRSQCIDRLRRRRRRPDLAGAANLEHVDDHEGTPGAAAALSAGADVSGLLRVVRPIERDCLTHVFFEGLTMTETAARTGLPVGSVKTHVRRALQRLREIVSPHDS